MPSLSHTALQSSTASHSNGSAHPPDARSASVWTRSNTDDVSLSQLHKFWGGLSVVARRDLLRIDKQTLFEQVRKNLYCSRCHGLLVEGFSQIILYGKSLQAGMVGQNSGGGTTGKQVSGKGHYAAVAGFADDSKDPSVHPWGGLAATRDSMLTVLDCFLDGMPLEVFECARARERERELLYPDACGGGGRGWICQNGSFNGRGHGLKETCALHTARLSCEALVDFWSALGDETRLSLLRMKEEDFIERLMFRFNSKRFCRDCRRNVLREFKEMKELKRSRKEPQCTQWFCAADSVFRYEVSKTAVHVDWHNCFVGDGGSPFQRFEWALGTGEGKSDIFPFEDVGLSEFAYVDNLDLANISACFIVVRGWNRDGRCTELSAKAHALKGQLCVHRRLIIGDGYVSITKGESIQRFFERAEETEEEDEDAVDKDGNDYEGEASRPQKHAKSPELARDFLLDAATVIFKEQVEKAFREGTARQNAHSIFVCLALSLLEERVRVACKEITSLEKQNKLLEEEEYEKREEEERRERRKQKEKEKKLRRKEKLKSKEKANRRNCSSVTLNPNGCLTASSLDVDHEEEQDSNSGSQVEGTESNHSEDSMSARPSSPDTVEARPSADGFDSENGGSSQHEALAPAQITDDALGLRDGNGAFIVERSKSAKRRTQGRKTSIDNSNGSFRRGSIPSLEADGNLRMTLNPHSSEVKEVLSSQEHQRNNVRKVGVKAVTKRVDGWSSSPTYNSNNRDETLQSCACGSSHVGSRSKVGQRGPGRPGVREPNASVGSGERSIIEGLSGKTLHRSDNVDPALVRRSTEQSLGMSVTANIFDRRDQRAGSITDRAAKTLHSRSSSLDLGFGASSGHCGVPKSSPNGAVGHGSLVNGLPASVALKPMWTPRAVNAPNGLTVKVSGTLPLDSEHGKDDHALIGSQARPVSPWPPPFKSASPKASSIVFEDFPGSAEEESTVTEHLSTSAEEEELEMPAPNAPVLPRTVITTDDSRGNLITSEIDFKVGGSPGTSAPNSEDESVSVQEVVPAVNAENCVVLEDIIYTDSRQGSSEEGQDSPRVLRPVATQGALNYVPETGLITQQHHSYRSAGILSGPSAHVHTNSHQQVNFPQGSLLRPPNNGMYAYTTDMLASQGHLQNAIQPPSMAPGAMNMRHPRPFGFFPMGPWAARGRTGVLPPQACVYAVSGPGGLPMGVLPPISLAAPGSVSPGGFAPNHLSAIPDGLNPLQIRDNQHNGTHQMYLSRFGDSPGRGSHGRIMVERTPGLKSDGSQVEGTSAADVGHVREGQKFLGHALSNDSQSPLLGMKERHHTASPTSADFSFFHSKWPISGGTNKTEAFTKASDSDTYRSSNLPVSCAERTQCLLGPDGVSKSSLPVGEYSLFASAPSKGFGLFGARVQGPM
ncbi:uncharacterized protein [Physcomitrium patens]|uniref:Stress response protein NST1 n=1 Tax=Physcomitrium patens TaxID=3218 RepID=A0A7I4E5L9_PHYPA|nr:uncharacterized protein LOC112283424 isoform X2 [Physcomitrium patens]|eukprot:XP_024377831.1 uncharacterized protein LOC112283424 isoform X2 [Physcomitrella patens]